MAASLSSYAMVHSPSDVCRGYPEPSSSLLQAFFCGAKEIMILAKWQMAATFESLQQQKQKSFLHAVAQSLSVGAVQRKKNPLMISRLIPK